MAMVPSQGVYPVHYKTPSCGTNAAATSRGPHRRDGDGDGCDDGRVAKT